MGENNFNDTKQLLFYVGKIVKHLKNTQIEDFKLDLSYGQKIEGDAMKELWNGFAVLKESENIKSISINFLGNKLQSDSKTTENLVNGLKYYEDSQIMFDLNLSQNYGRYKKDSVLEKINKLKNS